MDLVQTFKTVWLSVVIELISSDSNPIAAFADSLHVALAIISVFTCNNFNYKVNFKIVGICDGAPSTARSCSIFSQNHFGTERIFTILEFQESDVLPGKTEVKQGNLLNLYPQRRVLLEKLKNLKT